MAKPVEGYCGYVVDGKPMRRPLMSGHCQFPQTDSPRASHDRCIKAGGGNTATPDKTFSPCPCWCHLGDDFECECGGIIRVALNMPTDDDGDPTYVHIDEEGNALYEGCFE